MVTEFVVDSSGIIKSPDVYRAIVHNKRSSCSTTPRAPGYGKGPRARSGRKLLPPPTCRRSSGLQGRSRCKS